MNTALAAALSVVVATTTFAQTGNPPPAKKDDNAKKAASEVVRKLSRRERKELTAKLDDRFQEFLSGVDPIILPAEIDTFLMLSTDAQRDSFVDDFWRRRDASMGNGNGHFREVYARRLEVAKQEFKRLNNDRAKLFLLDGPPAEVVRADCDAFLQPIEVWKYPFIKGLGYNVRLLFYKPRDLGDYRLWNPIGGNTAISDLLSHAAFEFSESDAMSQHALTSASPYAYLNKIQLECRQGDEIMRAITQMVQSRVDLMKLFEPPAVNEEDVAKILRSMVIENPKAQKLDAEFSVRYPTKDGSRTDVQMTLLVPRTQVTPAAVGEAEVYTVDVTGEVLRDGQLWEKYRYRFDFPGDFNGDKLPIVVDRLLRPAQYLSRIKVTDANTGAEAIVENPLDVPEVFLPEPEVVAQTAPAATPEAMAEPKSPPAVAMPVVVDDKPALRIVPPSGEVVTGIHTIETIASGDAIKGVEFWLDGRKLAVRRAPPFTLDFDFGDIPQTRRIRAVALDAKGKPLTGDDLWINTGTDPFRVRIVSPRIAPHLVGPSRVEVEVHVPDGDELDALELYWNETRVATMFDPPFVQMVDIPATDGVGYIRAVARLKDPDAAPIEDVVMINTPAYMEELNIHLVEIPAVVTIGGKPATDLTEKAFTILDEGKPIPIAKFEYVKNLPLAIGMAIDTSGSMQPRMDEAQKAGAQFFENVMKKGDKAFLVAFDTEAQLVQKWSTRISDVHAGLAKLRAEESTSLYDAVIYALYNFQGIKGQKALVLISDGKDTSSKYSFEQSLEYARRAGVPIYGIGIGMRAGEIDVRSKLGRLCTETGGSLWTIDQARDLQRVYNEIQTELRSQYILGFYPPSDLKTGSKWRELTVQVAQGKAKTVKGYFP